MDAKFLFLGAEKLWLRGVTYGTFDGDGYPDVGTVRRDLEQAVAAGVNSLRVYTPPPRWLLDFALELGICVLVGIPWEQHVTFLDDRSRRRLIERRISEGVAACAGHPAVLGYAIGNEIPPSIVRWHGPARVERFLERLHRVAKEADPDGLVTYVNFPSTEYLELAFLDFVAFNVYLEDAASFEAYLTRLQTLAGDRPLVITELGLDSIRHGPEAQARAVETQLRSAFASGCAGAFTFSWTDEWFRDGVEVSDWSFGLVDRDRVPKPALGAARRAHAASPFPRAEDGGDLPRASVVVCTYNGARTLAECLDGAALLDYPSYEVIVIDDGSTDASATIASRSGVRLISTPQQGLSAARNAGTLAAAGEIVAFLDDDCRPDRDWLRYLVETLLTSSHIGAGGPNVPPAGEGLVARCVAKAPGGPTHVLLSDTKAEHIAGCNMAFWRDALIAMDGFDERFWQAGDDVDLCWRVHEAGRTLGFHPSALVWHRRRRSVSAYLRQQRSYGRAEALLERKWPERYNGRGHVTWNGHIYGGSAPHRRRRRVNYGTWGTSLLQSAADRAPSNSAVLPVMPEWYLVLALLAALAVLSPWLPLLTIPPLGFPIAPLLLAIATGSAIARAALQARRLPRSPRAGQLRNICEPALVALLALLQPLARLSGRLRAGLTPWRRTAGPRLGPLRPWVSSVWYERGATPSSWLIDLESQLRARNAAVIRGGPCDRWDLKIRVGAVGSSLVQLAVEEHGHGRQLLRFRTTPRPAAASRWLVGGLLVLCAIAAAAANAPALLLLGALATLSALRIASDCAAAAATVGEVLSTWGEAPERIAVRSARLAEAPSLRLVPGAAPLAVASVAAPVTMASDSPPRAAAGGEDG